MGRDNPDPALILQSSRQRKPVTDPTNGEPVVTAMETLVTRIDQLSRALPKTVALGTRDDQIYHAMHRIHGPDDTDGPSTFNRRMDFLFGEDCRNSDGRLHHVRRGANGMTLIVKYLEKVEWSAMICDIATIKLNRIIVELEFLCTGTAASIPESSKSKRKSPDESAVDDGPQVKRIRSTNDGKVTIEEVDGEDDAGDDAFSPDDGSSSSDNEDEVSSNEAGPSKSPD
ncbi:hypothetical protein B0H19DRAFT_533319 [Mycena capillaripes]|nr:hypothetical protein B0H19DRAFT_532876 [Mycena capillaripes]KAJ6528897.1 hypothetical protein B0H19DRAFT_533319 [Mycena capillaripes]